MTINRRWGLIAARQGGPRSCGGELGAVGECTNPNSNKRQPINHQHIPGSPSLCIVDHNPILQLFSQHLCPPSPPSTDWPPSITPTKVTFQTLPNDRLYYIYPVASLITVHVYLLAFCGGTTTVQLPKTCLKKR